MEVLVYCQEPQLRGMRAIDLNFIQKLIRKMEPTEEGKLHTLMVSDDHCKRALVSGLDNFAIVQFTTKSYLILTSISSYYHACMYNEDPSSFTAIAILTEDDAQIKIMCKELASYTNVIIPSNSSAREPNNTIKLNGKCLLLSANNKKLMIVTDDSQVEEARDSLDKEYLIVNINKRYEAPITAVAKEFPGIVL
jgi:hypothetical protein